MCSKTDRDNIWFANLKLRKIHWAKWVKVVRLSSDVLLATIRVTFIVHFQALTVSEATWHEISSLFIFTSLMTEKYLKQKLKGNQRKFTWVEPRKFVSQPNDFPEKLSFKCNLNFMSTWFLNCFIFPLENRQLSARFFFHFTQIYIARTIIQHCNVEVESEICHRILFVFNLYRKLCEGVRGGRFVSAGVERWKEMTCWLWIALMMNFNGNFRD